MSQPTSREGQRDRLLEAALVHVPFDGWSRRSTFAGAADLGLEPVWRAWPFPGAGDDMLVHLERWADRAMLARVGPLDDLRVRERIARLVRTRLDVLGPHREAMRRATAARLMPSNGLTACGSLWRTVDLMWSAAGDDARDTSYYTKRSLLAAVWTSVLVLAGGPLGGQRRDLVLSRAAHRQRHADRPAARSHRRLLQAVRPAQPHGATAVTAVRRRPASGGQRARGHLLLVRRRGPCARFKNGRSAPAVHVLIADDVVLAEVSAALHFDQAHRHGARILHAMPGAKRHVYALIRFQRHDLVAHGDARGTGDHHPVLGAVLVALQAEAATGRDHDLLDLEARTLVQHAETAPGSLLLRVRAASARPACCNSATSRLPASVSRRSLTSTASGVSITARSRTPARDHAAFGMDQAVRAPVQESRAAHGVARCILRQLLPERLPGAEIGPPGSHGSTAIRSACSITALPATSSAAGTAR